MAKLTLYVVFAVKVVERRLRAPTLAAFPVTTATPAFPVATASGLYEAGSLRKTPELPIRDQVFAGKENSSPVVGVSAPPFVAYSTTLLLTDKSQEVLVEEMTEDFPL